MSEEMELGPGAEFDAIRSMMKRWGNRAVGLGDDAGEVKVPRGETLVVSVDDAVDRIHFKREWISPREIGYRAVTAALSDIAAMAAKPIGVLTSITLPPQWRVSLDDLAAGIGDAVDAARTVIRGGNLSDGPALTIATTVLGSAFRPARRSSAKVGDAIYVTGELGGSATALRLLESGRDAGEFRERLTHPSARIAEALWLADHGAQAMIDVSDGLVADLRHVAAASTVSMTIDAHCVPCFRDAALQDALTGGEEYELIVTAPRELDTVLFSERFGTRLTRIGSVIPREHDFVVVRGAVVAALRGYDHFSH